MHELSVTHDILAIVLKHAEANAVRQVKSVQLSIGALSDLEATWIQRYFDALSRDTVAAGATLEVRRSPAIVRCENCSNEFAVALREVREIRCPQCTGTDCSLISGTEYRIETMEALA